MWVWWKQGNYFVSHFKCVAWGKSFDFKVSFVSQGISISLTHTHTQIKNKTNKKKPPRTRPIETNNLRQKVYFLKKCIYLL